MSDIIERLQSTLASGKDGLLVRFGLGQALVEHERFEEAAEHLQAALAFDEKHSASWLWLGKALEGQGKLAQAVRAWESGLSVAQAQGDQQIVRMLEVFLKRHHGKIPRPTIYHNPVCGTSRKVLQILRDYGTDPIVVEYLRDTPSRHTLAGLLAQAGLTPREAIRSKEELYKVLGLDAPEITDEQLLDAMAENAILINRPFVSTQAGTRLCRPAEVVFEIL